MIVKSIIMSPAQPWHKTSHFPVLLLCAMTDAHFVIRLYNYLFSFNIFPRSLNKHGISQKERKNYSTKIVTLHFDRSQHFVWNVPLTLADIRGGAPSSPWGPNSFNFMQFLGKFAKIVYWRLPWRVGAPPHGTPGSATGSLKHMEVRRPMSRPWNIRIQTLFEILFVMTYKAQQIFTSRLHLNIWYLPSSFTGQTHNGTLSPRWSFPCDLTCWFVSTRTITAPITQVRTEV